MKINKNGLMAQLRDFGIGQIVGLVLSLVSVPITTRFIAPEEFGKTSLFSLVQTIFYMFALLGTDQAYTRFYNDKNLNKNQLLFNIIIFPLLISFVTAFIVQFFRRSVSNYIFGQYESLIIYSLIINLPASVISRFAMLSIRMELKGKLFSFLTFINQLTGTLFCILFLIFYEKSFKAVVYAGILNNFINTILQIIYSKAFNGIFKEKLNKELLKEIYKFSLPLVPAALLTWLLNSFDKIGLRSWSTFTELGLYAAAFKIVQLLNVVQNIFTTTWCPVAYKWHEEGIDNSRFELVGTIVLAVMVVLYSLIIIFRDVILLFLGSEYRNTSEIFVFLLFVPVMYCISETTCLGITFSKKTIFSLIVSVIVTLFNIVGNYILIPKFGARGAAVSTCISYLIFFWSRTLFSRKLWYKIKLGKYIVNIFALLCFCVNIITLKNKIIEITIFIFILIFNIIILRPFYSEFKKGMKQ